MRNYNLFDTFTVYHKLYDIDIQTKVTGIVYDALAEKKIKSLREISKLLFINSKAKTFKKL